jgi:hypothetical protein
MSSWGAQLAYTPSGQPTTAEDVAKSQQPCKGERSPLAEAGIMFGLRSVRNMKDS